jgi:hypothetical protein
MHSNHMSISGEDLEGGEFMFGDDAVFRELCLGEEMGEF